MSSLGINSLGQGLSQMFGPSAAGWASQARPTTSSPAASAASTGTTSSAAAGQPPRVGGHHRSHGGGSGQFQKIQDAVTGALQSAQSIGGTANANKIIEDAIAKVFKQQAGSSSSSTSSNAAQADDETDVAGHAKANSSASQQAFVKTLRSLGVSPQQFRNDFLAAIQDVQQNGNINVNAALKSLPKGSIFDALG